MADVLIVKESIKFELTKNGVDLYTQYYQSADSVTYTRHASDRVVLSTNMAAYQEASLGDINTTNLGEHMLVVSDNPIYVAVNSTDQYIYAETLFMSGASISHLYFKNTSTTKLATVSYVVTDQNA